VNIVDSNLPLIALVVVVPGTNNDNSKPVGF